MKNRKTALLFILLASAAALATAQGTDPVIVLDGMAAKYYLPEVIAAFGTFTFQDTNLPTPFSRWFETYIAGKATKTTHLEVLNQSAAAAMDPAFRSTYEAFFRDTPAQAMLHGTFYIERDMVKIHLELTNLSTAILIGEDTLSVPLSEIPPYISVAPSTDATARAMELTRLGVTAPGGLAVSVTTDRGPGAAYVEGELLSVLVTVNKDAYVRVFHVSSAGVIQLIWPNMFCADMQGKVAAGATVRLPGPSDPFIFKMTPPYGTEFIKVIASTVPFSGSETAFSNLGTSARNVMTRGLAGVAGGAPEAAEDMASYFIGPAAH